MPGKDIFLSYASEDRDRIGPLVHALEAKGWTVFWDRMIPTGKTWRQVLDEEIGSCRAMVVVWSKDSVTSEYVLEEATEGKDGKILFPVLIDEGVTPPRGFRGIQAADLAHWDGTPTAPESQTLVNDLGQHLGRARSKTEEERLLEQFLKELTIERVVDHSQVERNITALEKSHPQIAGVLRDYHHKRSHHRGLVRRICEGKDRRAAAADFFVSQQDLAHAEVRVSEAFEKANEHIWETLHGNPSMSEDARAALRKMLLRPDDYGFHWRTQEVSSRFTTAMKGAVLKDF